MTAMTRNGPRVPRSARLDGMVASLRPWGARVLVATAFAAALVQTAAPAQAVRLQREPQVWATTATSFVVAFRSTADVVGEVEWGPTPALGSRLRGPVAHNHFLEIRGLKPDRFYWYRVRIANNPWTPTYRTRTFPATGADVSFFVMADCGAFTPMQFAVRDLLGTYTFDLGLLPGDIVYPDGDARHFDWRFFWPYANLLKTTPFFPVVGNHDVATKNGAAFYRYFRLPTANSGTEAYYSFDHGRVHFIGLDSELTSRTAQAAWLRQDVAKARARGARWIFVQLHRPAYTSGPHGRSRSIHAAFSKLFEELEVDAVFTGHDHHYERSKVVRDFYPNKRGVVYFVVGTGGQWVRPVGKPEPYSAFAVATNGILRVEVHGDVMRAEFVDASLFGYGKVLDRFVLAKGPVSPALRATGPHPFPGQSLHFALDGPPGAAYWVLFSDRPGHLPLGELGTYHLELGREVLLASGKLEAGGTAPLSLRVPTDPKLRGIDLLLQGLIATGSSARLTDVLVSRVR